MSSDNELKRPGKRCAICGASSGMYPLCVKCFKLRDAGDIEQCPACKTWYKSKDGHTCEKVEPPKIHRLEYTKQAIIKKDDSALSADVDPRKKWEAVHRSEDGHYVRSYSEVLIDNWLYNHGYVHSYEKSVFMKKNPYENVLSDFFLPKGEIYIEFWGIKNNDYYADRKEHKIALYENNGFNLINLEEDDIKLLDDKMPRLLFKFIKD
jgi:hypothetical protein